jgi:hypothetical protein
MSTNERTSARQLQNATQYAAIAASETNYAPLGGGTIQTAASPASRKLKMAAIFKNMRVYISEATLTDGATAIALYVNGAATSLSIPIVNGTTGWYENLTQEVYAGADQEVCWRVVTGTFVAPGDFVIDQLLVDEIPLVTQK